MAELKYWLSHGWHTYRSNFKKVIIVSAVYFVCNYLLRFLLYLPNGLWICRLSVLVIMPVLGAGYTFYCLKLSREAPVCTQDFMAGFVHFGKVWFTSLLVNVLVATGLFLLVIPGILWALRYNLSVISVLDKQLSPLQAMKFSSKITEGHRMKLFLLYLLMAALGALHLPFYNYLRSSSIGYISPVIVVYFGLFMLSLVVLVPWMIISFAVAYDTLTKLEDSRKGNLDTKENPQGSSIG